jgi:hypothetical protein
LVHHDPGSGLTAAKGGRRGRMDWPAVNRSWGRGAPVGVDGLGEGRAHAHGCEMQTRRCREAKTEVAARRRGRKGGRRPIAGRCAGSLNKLETFLRPEKRDSQRDVGDGKEEQAEE